MRGRDYQCRGDLRGVRMKNMAERDRVARGGPFWSQGWFWFLLAIASTMPFVVAPLPMMPDYFSHIGRYHVMNHGAGSPYLSQYYSYHWQLIGNLGVDLLMVPLGHLFPTETAATIAAGAIPPLTIAGIYAVATAVWGRVEAPALLALPFVYTYSFLFGFVNYHLALALALLTFALWIRSARWPLAARLAIGIPLALMVWVAHVAGWAVLMVAIGCFELVAVRRSGASWPKALLVAGLRVAPVAAPLALTFAWRGSTGTATAPLLYDFRLKAAWLFVVLKSENRWLDIATVLALGVAAAALLLIRSFRRDLRVLLGALALAIFFVALPTVLFGSFYADERLLPALAILLFLGCAVPAGRSRTLVVALGLSLFTVRLAATTAGWYQRGNDAVQDLAALDPIPRGSRIAVIATPSYCESWQLHGREQLPGLAIVRREAFVDSEWDAAGAQLMQPIYNLGRGFNDTTSTRLIGKRRSCQGRPLEVILSDLPQGRFDYVWAFDAPAPAVTWLRLAYAGPHGRLYAIAR
jgi:hypothetical protein